jgi:hypothetical protein
LAKVRAACDSALKAVPFEELTREQALELVKVQLTEVLKKVAQPPSPEVNVVKVEHGQNNTYTITWSAFISQVFTIDGQPEPAQPEIPAED